MTTPVDPHTMVAIVEITKQLNDMYAHLTGIVCDTGSNELNADKMTSAELIGVLTVFNEVGTITKGIRSNISVLSQWYGWERCDILFQRIVCYVEQLEMRPLMALSMFTVMYERIECAISDLTVHLSNMANM